MCIASGTVCGYCLQLTGVSRNTRMRLLMKLSMQLFVVVEMATARAFAGAKVAVLSSPIMAGIVSWSGLYNVSRSHSAHWPISLARSVMISEKLHQMGGVGDPPNVRQL